MTESGIIELSPNQPAARPYRGGSGIAAFRGVEQPDAYRPEDFLGSTTEVFAGGGVGLTTLDDGRTLRQAIAADPAAFLGPDAATAHGPQAGSGLLTKLLSTDERLFVHAHPDNDFAQANGLGDLGKTESWFVLDVAPDTDAFVLFGFNREVTHEELMRWFEEQAVDEMVAAMHRIPVSPGDTFHVPAGMPHGIGPGITLVELQQPTDLSILLEYQGYPGLDRRSALLGLDADQALAAISRTPVSADEIDGLRRPREIVGRVQPLFPESAEAFYSAQLVHVGEDPVTLPAGFAVIVVRAGAGALRPSASEAIDARAGQVFLTKHIAGDVEVDPGLELVVCRPAEPGR